MLSENVATYLENSGVGTKGTDIFIGSMREEQDNCLLIEDTGGLEPDRYLPIEKMTIQVTVRNTDYKTGYEKTREVYNILHQKGDSTVLEIGGADVMISEALSEPTWIGQDESQRNMFTTNFILWIRE